MSPGSSSHSSLGSKSASIFSGTSSRRRGASRAADPPAPAPGDLQQEDVVRIDVRTDAAAVARVRDHDVVEARIGDEAKARAAADAPRSSCRSTPCTSSVQRRRRQRRQRAPRERPGPHRPALARRARPGAIRRRRARPARTAARAVEAGERVGQRGAHQQRLLLPVAAHERRRPTDRRARPSADRDPCLIVR